MRTLLFHCMLNESFLVIPITIISQTAKRCNEDLFDFLLGYVIITVDILESFAFLRYYHYMDDSGVKSPFGVKPTWGMCSMMA